MEDCCKNDKIGISNKFIWIVGILLVLGIVGFFIIGGSSNVEALQNFGGDVTIYKSGSCGCCGVWSQYFQGKSKLDTNIVEQPDISNIKEQLGVPKALESCHTTKIGDYFVEGHIPVEAINKLIEEQPDIAGIAMPGMPNGSPGMPGAKTGDFVIYSVNHDGTYQEFMRI